MNYFKHKMRGKNPAAIAGMVILGIIGITALVILFGFVIMWLWNALMPEIFGLPMISYWQGIGLFILAKILCGVGGGGGSKGKSSHRKQGKCSDKEKKNDFSKWKLYDKFWEEEGDAAYQDFIKRKNGDDSNGNVSEEIQ
jgi:hypothetical protein|tara:strand:- start:14448 stop:14867 length:420 start_codon:yes stop_codon:yes gene_type:complete